MLSRRHLLSVLSAAAGSSAFGAACGAETYPLRPIRLIVTFPPGGVNDTVARPWAERMRDQVGSIVIENIGGAGGAVGALAAALLPDRRDHSRGIRHRASSRGYRGTRFTA